MASIQVRKENKKLLFDFYYKGVRCREQTILDDTAQNRKKMEKTLKRIEEEISLGIFEYQRFFPSSKLAAKFSQGRGGESPAKPLQQDINGNTPVGAYDPEHPLFHDFAELWHQENLVSWRASYRKTVRATLDKHLLPAFGEKVVSSVTKADILNLRSELAKAPGRSKEDNLSNRRINAIMTPLRQILNEAADRFDFITPFRNIKPLKIRRSDVEPFTFEEVNAILQTVRPDFRNYYLTRFFTGMRTGEIDGLKWKYVDFERRLILVRETIVAGEEEYTKTDSSQRDILMSQPVVEALQEQAKVTRHLSEYVFCNRLGHPLTHVNVTKRVWYPLLRHLGLKLRRPYQTRHTAATLWLAAGENPEWIARQMGHSSTEMLFRVYSRFVPNLTRQDGSAFERLLLQSRGEGGCNKRSR